MKEKLIAFVLACLMVLSLTACGSQKGQEGTVNGGNGDVTTDNGGNNAGNGGTNGGNGGSNGGNSGTTGGSGSTGSNGGNGTTGDSGGNDTISGNAKGRTWDSDTRNGVQDNFNGNHGSTFGGIGQDNSVYDDMTGYRTSGTATWQQMLQNGRVHDTDGYLLDGENTTW